VGGAVYRWFYKKNGFFFKKRFGGAGAEPYTGPAESIIPPGRAGPGSLRSLGVSNRAHVSGVRAGGGRSRGHGGLTGVGRAVFFILSFFFLETYFQI
jgi:hypothetical protein